LDQARSKAAVLHGKVRNLEDPAAAIKKQKAEAMNVSDLWVRFDAEHIATKRPTTQKGYRHYAKKYILPELGRMIVQDVGLAQVKDLQRRAAKTSDRAANYTIAVMSRFMSFAEEDGIIPPGSNPCQAVTRKPEKPRQRFLDGEEIERVWSAIETLEGEGAKVTIAASRGPIHYKIHPAPAAALQVLLLTGCRYSEVLHLRWDEIAVRDEEGNAVAVLTEHKTMSRGDRLVVLSPEALEIIKSIPRHSLSPYVFAGGGKDGTIGNSLGQAWRAVRDLAGLPGVRIHDLRHTFASVAIASGATLEQTGQLLGHSTPQTTKRYAHLIEEAARANLAKVTPGLLRKKKA
jgi:integrase